MEEIWSQSNGEVDILVVGAGTGGAVTGLARGLRRKEKMNGRDLVVAGVVPVG